MVNWTFWVVQIWKLAKSAVTPECILCLIALFNQKLWLPLGWSLGQDKCILPLFSTSVEKHPHIFALKDKTKTDNVGSGR